MVLHNYSGKKRKKIKSKTKKNKVRRFLIFILILSIFLILLSINSTKRVFEISGKATLDEDKPIAFTALTSKNNVIQKNNNIFVEVSNNISGNHYTFLEFNKDILLMMEMDNLNENSVLDSSSYNNHGYITSNANKDLGYFGESIRLKNSYVTLQKMPLGGEYTVSLWINPTLSSLYSGEGTALISSIQGRTPSDFILSINSSGSIIFYYYEGEDPKAINAGKVRNELWNHIVVTSEPSIYLDNIKQIPIKIEIFPETISGNYIGNGIASQNYYSGLVDELIIFNRTLNYQEIYSLHSPYKYFRNFTDLINGEYSFIAYTVNSSGDIRYSELRKIRIDNQKPKITLVSPDNSQIFYSDLMKVKFEYIVSDISGIYNCTLSINNMKIVNPAIDQVFINYFVEELSPGNYFWGISCTDNANLVGFSGSRKLTIVNISDIQDKYIREPIEKLDDNKTPYVDINPLEFSIIEEESIIRIPFDIKKKSISCKPDWQCGEWGKCSAHYNVENLIKGYNQVFGEQERLCIDRNNCFFTKVEKTSCDSKIPVFTKNANKCFNSYVEVYDINGEIISRLLLEKTDEIKRLNIDFIFGDDYCSYCFDGIKNYDEEGIDCGPSCQIC